MGSTDYLREDYISFEATESVSRQALQALWYSRLETINISSVLNAWGKIYTNDAQHHNALMIRHKKLQFLKLRIKAIHTNKTNDIFTATKTHFHVISV